MNSIIKNWYEEAIKVTLEHETRDSSFIIYKGFKITKTGDDYQIEYTRSSDFYTSVSDKNLELFKNKGFIKGASFLGYNRDKKRVSYYLGEIAELYEKRAEALKKSKKKRISMKDKAFYLKQIKNCNKNIENLNSLRTFYQTRQEQFKH
jgi:hypothetical protein